MPRFELRHSFFNISPESNNKLFNNLYALKSILIFYDL